jgi:hypothetical protein
VEADVVVADDVAVFEPAGGAVVWGFVLEEDEVDTGACLFSGEAVDGALGGAFHGVVGGAGDEEDEVGLAEAALGPWGDVVVGLEDDEFFAAFEVVEPIAEAAEGFAVAVVDGGVFGGEVGLADESAVAAGVCE